MADTTAAGSGAQKDENFEKRKVHSLLTYKNYLFHSRDKNFPNCYVLDANNNFHTFDCQYLAAGWKTQEEQKAFAMAKKAEKAARKKQQEEAYEAHRKKLHKNQAKAMYSIQNGKKV